MWFRIQRSTLEVDLRRHYKSIAVIGARYRIQKMAISCASQAIQTCVRRGCNYVEPQLVSLNRFSTYEWAQWLYDIMMPVKAIMTVATGINDWCW